MTDKELHDLLLEIIIEVNARLHRPTSLPMELLQNAVDEIAGRLNDPFQNQAQALVDARGSDYWELFTDWKYEVENNDTRLGLVDWIARNLEQDYETLPAGLDPDDGYFYADVGYPF